MELLKLLSANEVVAQIISFLLLLIIMRLLVWKKFLKVLDDRKNKVASESKNIEETKKEIEKLKSDYERKLDQITETAKLKMQDAIAEGKRIAQEIKQGAELDSQKIIKNAEEAIKDELARARDVLRDDIVNLTISAAEKVVGEKLTDAEDKKLVEGFLKQVEKGT
jgi:F-type H+-transporting ATPase subunit b